MDIQVCFIPQTTGDHTVYYKLSTAGSYQSVTINIPTAGVFTCETITVPTNYCEDVTYEGYVIPDCADPTDSNEDGIPDAGEQAQFSVSITTQDPNCEPYIIACAAVQVVDINIINGGTGYTSLDEIVANGVDTIGFVQQSGGVITGFTPALPFTYSVVPTLTITSGTGSNGDIEAILGTCSFFGTGCDGQTSALGDTSAGPLQTILPLNGDMEICSDGVPDIGVTEGNLQVLSAPGENCKCRDCVLMTVTNGTGDNVTLSFTTCGADDNDVIYQQLTIPTGTLDLDINICVISGSIGWDTDNPAFSVAESPCSIGA